MIWTLNALTKSANCAAGIVAVVAVLVALYKKLSLERKGIPLPPGPPARWFWNNALPAVK